MKKRNFLFLILAGSFFLFTGCSSLKTKSPSEINFSMKMPGSFKYLNQKKASSYIVNNSFIDDLVELLDAKYCAYAYEKDMSNSYVLMIQFDADKIEQHTGKKIIDSRTAASAFGYDSGYERIITAHGTDFVVMPGFSASTIIAEKGGNVYLIIISINWLDPKSDWDVGLIDKMGESMKANAHGFFMGIWDGFKVPVAAIIRIWNPGSRVFATSNNGASYIIGFILGVILLLGAVFGGGSKAKN